MLSRFKNQKEILNSFPSRGRVLPEKLSYIKTVKIQLLRDDVNGVYTVINTGPQIVNINTINV